MQGLQIKKQIIYILPFLFSIGCDQIETKRVISTYKNGNPEIVYYLTDKDDTLTYRKEVFYESGKQNYKRHFVKEPKMAFGLGGMKMETKKTNVNMWMASMLTQFIIGTRAVI